MENFRHFEVGPGLDGRTWRVNLVWLQTAISIRTADAVDVKFVLADGEITEEKVIALPHPILRQTAKAKGHPITDPWCMQLAARHLKWMIETGEDLEKNLVTMSMADLERADREASTAAVPSR